MERHHQGLDLGLASLLHQPPQLPDIGKVRAVNEQRFEIEFMQLLSARAPEWRMAAQQCSLN
jgi:hypothetical protein